MENFENEKNVEIIDLFRNFQKFCKSEIAVL